MKHKRERKDPWLWDKSNRDLGQLEKWKTIARTKTVSHTCKAPLVYKIADWNQQWEDKSSSHRLKERQILSLEYSIFFSGQTYFSLIFSEVIQMK